MAEIAFLGLGAMGSRMAQRLADAGHDVRVWNRSAGRAAALAAPRITVADTPAAAARKASFVIAMLRDDAASREVWLAPETGALAAMAPGAVAIESSTLSRQWVMELSAAAAARGLAYIDAPVVGTRPQADSGTLTHLVGADATDLERARPILAAQGNTLHHLGPVGSGTAMKLAVNLLFTGQVALLAEALGALVRQGLTIEAAVTLLGETPVISPVARIALQSIAAARFDPLFPIELVAKDLGYFATSAESAGARAPLAEALRNAYGQADAAGFGGEQLTAIAKLYGVV